MTFVKNIWYVAGWSQDFEPGHPYGMTIADEPVVLFRRTDGTMAAMRDRCPHRWAPLSLGRVEGDSLRCMYHGVRFDGNGRCVEVPEQKGTPAALSVRTYPIVERHRWVWVWTGDPSLADPSLITDVSYMDDDAGRRHRFASLDYAANHMGICDNLLDLSHVSFLHENTLAAAATKIEFKAKIAEIENGVRVSYWKKGSASGAMSRTADGTLTDVFNNYDFVVPGIFKFRSRAYPGGTADALEEGAAPDDMPALLDDVSAQAVTPMTEGSTRYFYSFGQRSDTSPERLDGMWSVVAAAFEEDRRMIEAQQRMIERFPGDSMIGIAADRSLVLFRRIVERLKLREQATQSDGRLVAAE